MNDLGHALSLHVDRELRVRRRLVLPVDTSIDAGETLDLPTTRLRVGAPPVGLLAVLERRRDVNEEEGSAGGSSGALDDVARGLARAGVRSGRGGDDGGTGAGELGL